MDLGRDRAGFDQRDRVGHGRGAKITARAPIMQAIRYGLRQLRRTPGFAAVAIVTLALGIGANTAIFSMIDGVVLAPLPYAQPERLVFVFARLRNTVNVLASAPDFRDWQRNARSFEQMAAVTGRSFDLTSPGTPAHLDGNAVSAGFFGTLGVKLTLGRDFTAQEDQHGGAPVAVISERLWKDRFNGSSGAIGKTVTLGGVDYAIIGVAPPLIRLEGDADVYTPLAQGDPIILNNRGAHGLLCVARLNGDVTTARAKSEMGAIQNRLDQLYPDVDRGLGTDVVPLKQALVGATGETLLLLLGAVGVVLLIACANVANLLLARSAARSGEFAIRAALGAGRMQIVRQLITESLLLSLAGGGLGLVVAKWAMPVMLAAVPGRLPRSENIGVNLPVLLFTFGLAVVVGIVFGLAPALKNSKTDLQVSLKERGRGVASGHHRAQRILVIAQMALTLILLSGASLLFRTVRQLWDANPGFVTQNVVTFKVGLSPSASKTPASMRVFYQQLLERIRTIPGIQAADLATPLPLGGQDNSAPFWIGSQATTSLAEAPRLLLYCTGPNYLETMGIPLLRGRFLTVKDTIKSEPVMVIDSVLARDYFGNRDPIGQTIRIPPGTTFRIVGIVGHVTHYGLGDLGLYTRNETYSSIYQVPDQWVPVMFEDLTVTIRTPLGVAAVMPAIRSVAYGGPVYDVRAMRELASASITSRSFPMLLLAAFAGLALVLASVGIYGVISYLMIERVHEIGIRMALGADKRDVLTMVIGQGLRLALGGVAIGAVAALLLGRLLSSFSHLLYGVKADDPLTFVAVSLVLIGAALAACYLPARRAAGVDPIVALRSE
jgi:predicted permease